jgi:pimeloyl-ACP methyl ester carboxylesterase
MAWHRISTLASGSLALRLRALRVRARRLVLHLAVPASCAIVAGVHAADAATAAARGPTPAAYLRQGTLTLPHCKGLQAYCGEIERPLDPDGVIPGRIAIHFEFYPHTQAGAAAGLLVATEGGPGYPATLSRDDYLALFAPLRAKRDVLIMDNRGTGKSGAIDCARLQKAPAWTIDAVAACGASLGDSAALYSTAYATDDLAAILSALRLTDIDLYGDSYGTYFAQVMAVRHPPLLRSLVLDGAYPLGGKDYAWYPGYAPAMRDKFNLACSRFAPCAARPGSSIDHLLPVIESLRAAPFAAAGVDFDGRERHFTANAALLATVMFASAPALATVRELDAAAAAFSGGDRAPMLRLMAETLASVDSRDPTGDAKQWSAGLAAAVMCQDPPQIFDMRLTPELRAADRDRAIAERRLTAPDTYAPFTIDEYRGLPLDYGFIEQCVAWPVAPAGHPASHVVPDAFTVPDIPALIISGELDNITTVADGAAVAAEFKRGRQLVIANSFHVNALPRARSPCAAELVRRFLDTLSPGDTGCTATVPALRLVPQFARRTADLPPAAPLVGNRADTKQLKAVTAALQTLGDVLTQVGGNSSGTGRGLRGGRFLITRHGGNVHVSLLQVRWTEDLAVSGVLDQAAGPAGPQTLVRARIEVSGPAGLTGHLQARWTDGTALASARVDGGFGTRRFGARHISAAAPAP